jgi:hypothetical protein
MVKGKLADLDELNADVVDKLGMRDTWGAKLKTDADAGADDAYTLYQAWKTSGDTKYLDKVFHDEIVTAEQRMWMMTDAHWWSDRVELFSDTLQRTRLGGMALRRNQLVPGHLVSWRFDTPTAAEDVGILVTGTGETSFMVTAFNLTGKPMHAVMTGWDVSAGQWKMVRAVDGAAEPASEVGLERTSSLDMTFEPGKTTTFAFTLTAAAPPPAKRFDLGIGADDVKPRKGGGIELTVHSLGAQPAPASVAILEDGDGRELSRAAVPGLAAPLDLKPKTAKVALKGEWKAGYRVRLKAEGAEITQLNNLVVARP